MAFLKNVDAFLGTGEANAQGQDLKTFLAGYDPKKFDCPSNTVDIIVLQPTGTVKSTETAYRLLMIRRGNHPCIGEWALPGGFVDIRENLEAAAKRELEEETGVKGIPLFQMRTWGDAKRDPRWRIITTSYLAVVDKDIPVRAGDDAADALWMDVSLALSGKRGKTADYKLSLNNQERNIAVWALIREKTRKQGVLVSTEYAVTESNGIAMDHGAIITQALVWLGSQS
ncbi:MAG: NUDIX hydrolase [Lachnospiraceae bacterium]|nr:NUDIX hydrolase [Lachnospiraceae bacterium]